MVASPRQISVRGHVYRNIRDVAHAKDMAVGRLVDQIVTNYLNRWGGTISICVDTYAAVEFKAAGLGITSGRLVDQLINDYLDREMALI